MYVCMCVYVCVWMYISIYRPSLSERDWMTPRQNFMKNRVSLTFLVSPVTCSLMYIYATYLKRTIDTDSYMLKSAENASLVISYA